MKHRIAVVGAGIAGVPCARLIADEGHEVTLLEKSRAAGGRMTTRCGDGWQCDHGAQFFTARDPSFSREVQRWCADGLAARWTGRLVAFDAAGVAQPVANHDRFVGAPRMHSVVAAAAASLRLHTLQTVTGLRHVDGGWVLTTRERGEWPDVFDAVVLAMPAHQAGVLLRDVSPALSVAVDRAAMQPTWALMLRYTDPPGAAFDAAFVNGGPLRWIANDSSKPGRNGQSVWVVHASAEWSSRNLERPVAAVCDQLLDAFNTIVPGEPDACTAHLWRYADVAKSTADESRGFVWRGAERLGLCGDWLAAGRVEGAWLSGRSLGAAMLRDMERSRW
ncbi:FAD-dependent oxidoreductase [Paraburkholderia sp. SUR17]|uniref:NAD(P)/FAD-dependent oxidoreductase n=1 Tax=Paraburkholderia sp. SUR17 TaxID=3034358 RepID=UPI0024079E32|nr:FAD-dependent oxidoreductase [Paraburkholderia sp. SUR17]WEY37690.1 FAD-dependent oxidoreductase [Paraburkholderia sp. SUR17]